MLQQPQQSHSLESWERRWDGHDRRHTAVAPDPGTPDPRQGGWVERTLRSNLNHDGSALYTISDDTKAVFRMDLKGRLSIAEPFFIGVDDLEGIAINADGSQLHAVQEETNAVISIDIASRRELSRRPLAAMANYASIARYFQDPPDNKGLEGITVNTRTGHLFVVKEGRPGLLIELDGGEQHPSGTPAQRPQRLRAPDGGG